VERSVSTRFNKVHPALKHAGYSATTLLPGEDSAAFETLHRALIAEFTPVGALEEDIVADIARLTWRKQNLATFRIAKLAKERHQEIQYEKIDGIDPVEQEEYRAAEEQARQELGDIYKLIDIGEPTTIEGLLGHVRHPFPATDFSSFLLPPCRRSCPRPPQPAKLSATAGTRKALRKTIAGRPR
jgi:hypothetical protein